MAFNENTRVKIPAILTLTRLGYKYLSLKNAKFDNETNIFTDIFCESIAEINKEKDIPKDDIKRLLTDISVMLDYKDLGKAFYERLVSTSGIKLIDFEDFSNNTFHVVTELPCKKDEEEFRPDITLLINGMPLCFIEVKKPNNKDGVLAERKRINDRFKNEKFRKFINISQILMYSNNMEYDTESIVPIQGAFYSTTATKEAFFNCFREEENKDVLFAGVKPENEETENIVLKDNNLTSIKHSEEFKTNKFLDNPTNRLIVSLFSKDRLKLLLKYAIAYVEKEDKNGNRTLEKHIMRYPQFFASKSMQYKLDEGTKKGIIWHTQGSGKTALAFYSVKWLTDYYQKNNIIPKFYFIVDRIDLQTQACKEFISRGLKVHTVSSREKFAEAIKEPASISNKSGQKEITVVNIQKFSEDATVTKSNYDINTQRIYFIDEAHRSYNPKGSFLANLTNSDPNAIFISLTGTPLLGNGKNRTSSKSIWGDYIHKYYYNSSIADGYTLKLIREGIETKYKAQLEEVLANITVKDQDIEAKQVFAHKKFVEPMLEYITEDLRKSRIRHGDDTLGAMVVCNSSEQAKMIFDVFNEKYEGKAKDKHSINSAALILHDVDTKEDRKDKVDEFKTGKIDILFVYNMLLTGFDAPRLKKLYIHREVKEHNLLQMLTRVNRPYKEFQYGYVVDFADIRKEFDKANKAYWDELQNELGDEMQNYSNIFKSQEEIETDIADIKNQLWKYDTNNAEEFSKQIIAIEDKGILLNIKKALEKAKDLYNIIRYSGFIELLDKLDFNKFKDMLAEVERHIANINLKDKLINGVDTAALLNEAIEDIIFMFIKVSERELKLADDLRDILKKTRECLANNFDKKDPAWISLKDRLEELFKKKNLSEITQEEMKENIEVLKQIYDRIKELNRTNDLLRAKYANDQKYARVHKRILEKSILTNKEAQICDMLKTIKSQADEKVLYNNDIINNEGLFTRMMGRFVITEFENQKFALTPEVAKYINSCIVNEYINEFKGNIA